MFIDSFSPQFPVSVSNACSCLDISRSGYYDWVARNRLPHQIDALEMQVKDELHKSSHRRARKAIRERTGRAETNREMEQFGDLLAILSNLWNEIYNKEIMDDCVDFGHALSSFMKDLPMLRKEYRKIRRGPAIQIADTKRMCILEDFIKVLESANQSSELIATLQSILGGETCAVTVC